LPRVQLTSARAAKLQPALMSHLDAAEAAAESESRRLKSRIQRLNHEQEKLLQSYYADAIPVDLLRKEQRRISRELAASNEALTATDITIGDVKEVLGQALRIASTCETSYAQADDEMRGVMNRFWFTKLFIRDLEIAGSEIADPMAAVLAVDLLERLEVEAQQTTSEHDWDRFVTEIRNHDPLEGRGSNVSRLVG
jgi:hypothetical protein